MHRSPFLLQPKSSRFIITRNRNLEPSCRVSVVVLHVSQLRCHPCYVGPSHGAWAATPVRALEGAYISTDLRARTALGNVIHSGPLSNAVLYWRVGTTAAPRTHLRAFREAHSRAIVNHCHVSKASAAYRFGACLLAGLWLGAAGDQAGDWFGGCYPRCRFNCETKTRANLIMMIVQSVLNTGILGKKIYEFSQQESNP